MFLKCIFRLAALRGNLTHCVSELYSAGSNFETHLFVCEEHNAFIPLRICRNNKYKLQTVGKALKRSKTRTFTGSPPQAPKKLGYFGHPKCRLLRIPPPLFSPKSRPEAEKNFRKLPTFSLFFLAFWSVFDAYLGSKSWCIYRAKPSRYWYNHKGSA